MSVAQDGSGNFTKIMDAVLAASNYSLKYYVIFVKSGVYREYVKISRHKWNLVMIGEGMDLTVVSDDRSNASGWKTFNTATFGKTIYTCIYIFMYPNLRVQNYRWYFLFLYVYIGLQGFRK